MANTDFKQKLVKEIAASLKEAEAVEVTTNEIVEKIKDTKGAFFTVKFIKKDGTERVLNGRFGVKKYLRGGDLPYDPIQKGLLPVWDPQAVERGGDGYRMITIGTIQSAKIGGVEYIVKNPDLAEEYKNQSTNKYINIDNEGDESLNKEAVTAYLKSVIDPEYIEAVDSFMSDDEGWSESEMYFFDVPEDPETTEEMVEEWAKQEISYYLFSKPDEFPSK